MPKPVKTLQIITLCLIISSINCLKSSALTISNDSSVIKGAVSQNITARKYRLGPNDLITVDIYDNPDYKQEKILIQPDGKITLVPIGTVNVAGLTVDELKDILVYKYKRFLNEPQITIKLDRTKPFIIYITGAVLAPGSYEINTDITNMLVQNSEIGLQRKTPMLTNMLVAAGGISFDADIENLEVRNEMENKTYKVNLLNLLEKGLSSEDLFLVEGDSIYVPRLESPLAISEEKYKKYAGASFSPKNIPIKVYGYVNNPGLISLSVAQSLNLNSAIMAAGGYLRDSAYAPSSIFISRADANGKLVTKIVNPAKNDCILLPNDIVYIPEKARPLAGKFLDFAVRILAPALSVTNIHTGWK